MSKKTVAVYTLGCKVNQYESEALIELFRQHGYEQVDFSHKADVYVVNTCTVTHLGDRKSRQMIRRAAKTNPGALVVVTGCYAQTSPGEVINIPGVDLVVGTQDRARLMDLVEHYERGEHPVSAVGNILATNEFEELTVSEFTGHTRAFMKIQEGCNNYCSYCIVPYARGPLRSRLPEKVITEARCLVGQGYQEIVLTGIHTGAYGRDLKQGDKINLALLIKELEQVEGLKRLRLSSVEPFDIDEGLIEALAASKITCRHFHIPLQSGDDEILHKMNRKYTTAEFVGLVNRIRDKIPGVAITTDLIVGFPGENENQFNNSFSFCEQIGFKDLHIFKYSPRRGTPAAAMPEQVPPQTKEARSRKMRRLAVCSSLAFSKQFLGQSMEILVEQQIETKPGFYEGLTDNYLRVIVKGDEYLKGRFVRVELQELTSDGHILAALS